MLAHRRSAGPLAEGGLLDAIGLAGAVTEVLVGRRSAAGDGAGDRADGWIRLDGSAPATYRAEVHQATGMISVQLGVPTAEALVRLRAHAYSRDRLIDDVAADVVARRLRFDDP